MNNLTRSMVAISLALLAAPALATEGGHLDLTLHYGYDKYDAVGLRSGLGNLSKSALLKDASTTLGATIIYWNGLGEFGAIGEVGRPGSRGSTTFLGALGGVGFGDMLRLELLGELGAHHYGDLLKDAAVVSQSRTSAWLVSVGLRPGLALHLGPNGGLLIGLWAFARWDVTSQDVQVNLAGGGTSTYKLGGSQFGASLRAGLSF